MTWPVHPLPVHVRALLLLPSGHRAFDEDVPVPIPIPMTYAVADDVYHLMHLHSGGRVDGETRALYVLGGAYRPQGFGVMRLDPEEAFDQ